MFQRMISATWSITVTLRLLSNIISRISNCLFIATKT
uniref:Uncharacterized protein n=1 Tax=Ascaris lumbricoides TaxID=6252 RepID=A0A0M3IR03_ASCLU